MDEIAQSIPELAESEPRAEYAASLWTRNVEWLVARGYAVADVIRTELVDRGVIRENSPEYRYLSLRGAR